MNSGAHFSPCRKWRYLLWRQWDASKPWANFLLMNPSTADEVDNDPTVERQQLRAGKWQDMRFMSIGGVLVTNVFAWRETDSTLLPGLIAQGKDIIGPENDRVILAAAKMAKIVVCGWGKPGHALLNRGARVIDLLTKNSINPYALAANKNGSPKHPLYVGYSTLPIPYFQWKVAA